MSSELIFFLGFLGLVVAMLAVDLGVVNRKAHVVTMREALIWTGVWIGMALLFYVFLLMRGELLHGPEAFGVASLSDVGAAELTAYRNQISLEYLTGYVIEKALSVDNIFVMIVIFQSFRVDPRHYHRILFWGILGAIVMRFAFIFAGVALVERFEWVLWIFGALLLYAGGKMLLGREGAESEQIDTRHHPIVRLARRFFPITRNDYDGRFTVKLRGRRFITPLLLVLLIIEGSDVIFAVDSIPAIFSVTLDPYIVFFSNIFAILGLRSLFFVISGFMDRFRYLKTGLGVLLAFIGAKMLLHGIFHVPIGTGLSLAIIAGILATSIAASMIIRPTD